MASQAQMTKKKRARKDENMKKNRQKRKHRLLKKERAQNPLYKKAS